MATIRKRNGRYHVQVRRKSFPAITSTFSRLTLARRWIASIEAEIENKTYINFSDAEKTTVNDVLNRYQKEILPTKKGNQVEKYRLGTLRNELGSHHLSDLAGVHIARYRDTRLLKVSPASVKRELVILSRALTIATQDWGIAMPQNPVSLVSLPKSDKARTRRLEDGEEMRLLSGLNKSSELEHIIHFALETAMRRGEILSIKKSHINFILSTLLIPSTKTDHPRTVPLSTTAVSVLRSQIQASERLSDGVIPLHEKPLFSYSARGLSGAFLRLCRRVGIVDLHFHDLRHEATSRLFERGLNPIEVASITGHKDTRMLLRYTHLRAEDLVKKLG